MEYEDAIDADANAGRLAIADGAAESSFAALWARLLVARFVTAPDHPSRSWAKELPQLRQTFQSRVAQHPLPWFAQDKLSEGTHAAFLGVEVGSGGPGEARAGKPSRSGTVAYSKSGDGLSRGHFR